MDAVLELTGHALRFGREHRLSEDVTILVESEPDGKDGQRFKVKVRIGGNAGNRLKASRRVRSRRKI